MEFAGMDSQTDAWGDGSILEVSPDEILDFSALSLASGRQGLADKVLNGPDPAASCACSDERTSGAADPAKIECSHEELMEYLAKHNFQTFLIDVAVYVASHFPPDPFDFLLEHIGPLVAKRRAARGTPGTLYCPQQHQQPPPQMTAAQREKVVRHVTVALQNAGTTSALASKLFGEFVGGAEDQSISEGTVGRLLAHLRAVWGLQEEDTTHMSEVLKRWRFRTNAARGTRGLPLWPLAKDDFMIAFTSLLRSVRDRYVPVGSGYVHRSLFVRRSSGDLEDKYELGPKLGRGAFGEVRLVTLRETKVKRVSKQVERRYQSVSEEDLVDEVNLLRGLDHPHIIRVFEFFESEKYVQMIMEPVFGGTLTNVVRGVFEGPDGGERDDWPGAFTEAWVATVLSQLSSALAYAHDVAGLIHKDLKPDNVLMVANPDLALEELLQEPVHAMLADFGIAEVFSQTALSSTSEQATRSGTSLTRSNSGIGTRNRSARVGGTPSYMSPEMFRGSFTEKCDLWSLGVVTFQMLTGTLPYKGANMFLLGRVVCDPRTHPPWERLSRRKWTHGARWFCQQLLSKDESARPSASEASRDAWLLKASAAREHAKPAQPEGVALHQSHLQSHLMTMARACITSQLNLSQLHQMNCLFKRYDVSGDGRLSYAEVRHVLEDVGVTSNENVELIIESLDSDQNGVIDYSEFVAGCIDISSETMKEQLRVVFSIFDLDGSGEITLDELRHVLTEGPSARVPAAPDASLHSVRSILPDGKTVEELMHELDADKQGTIEFHEFELYLLNEHEKVGRNKRPRQQRFLSHRGRRFLYIPPHD